MKTKQSLRLVALVLSLFAASSVFAAPNKEKAFSRIDADGSGTISAEELEADMVKMINRKAKKEGQDEATVAEKAKGAGKRAANRIRRSDKDGDGELSLEEFSNPPAKGKDKPKDKDKPEDEDEGEGKPEKKEKDKGKKDKGKDK